MTAHTCAICTFAVETDGQELPEGWRHFGHDRAPSMRPLATICAACADDMLRRFKQANDDAEQSR